MSAEPDGRRTSRGKRGGTATYDALVVLLYLGWPGIVIGGASGALIWRRHKAWWALGLALAGLVAAIIARIALAV